MNDISILTLIFNKFQYCEKLYSSQFMGLGDKKGRSPLHPLKKHFSVIHLYAIINFNIETDNKILVNQNTQYHWCIIICTYIFWWVFGNFIKCSSRLIN